MVIKLGATPLSKISKHWEEIMVKVADNKVKIGNAIKNSNRQWKNSEVYHKNE